MTETIQSCPNCDEVVSTALVKCPYCDAYLEQLPTVREWIIVTLFYAIAGAILVTCISAVLGGAIWIITHEIKAFLICVAFGATLGCALGSGFRFVALFESVLRRRISRASKGYEMIGRVAISTMFATSVVIAVIVVCRLVAGPPAPPAWHFYCPIVLGGVVVGGVLSLLVHCSH